MMNRAARSIAFGRVLNKLGLDKLELAISGAAPLPQETAALWQIWGVNLVEAYGQTETGGAFISGQGQAFLEARQCRHHRQGLAGAARRRGTNPGQGAGSVRRLLESAGRNEADRRWRRLAAYRRCRRMAEWQFAPDRPRARLHGDRRRQDHLALDHRERSARQPLYRRGHRVRARPQISHRADRDRFRFGRRLGARP